MGPGEKLLSFVRSAIFGLVRENFPLKSHHGRVKKYRGQGLVGLLFTAGQKYARVESLKILNKLFLLESM